MNYNQINLSDLSASSLEVIVWGICIGIVLATLLSVLYKCFTAPFIKALIKAEAFDEARAKTLRELNFSGKWYIKNELKYQSKAMRRYVVPVVDGDSSQGADLTAKKVDVETARFYLPEDKKIEAEIRFTEAKNPVFTIVITAVLVFAAAVFAMTAAPELMQMLQNFISTL